MTERIKSLRPFLVALVVAASIIACPFGVRSDYWNRTWYSVWCLGSLVSAALWALWIGKRLNVLLVPFLVTTVCGAIYYASYSPDAFVFTILNHDEPTSVQPMFVKTMAALSALTCVLFVSAMALASERILLFIRNTLAAVCVASAAYTAIQAFFLDSYFRAAWMGNASMNGCLIALTMPFLVEVLPGRSSWVCLLPCAAILLTGASVPVGVFSVVVAAMAWERIWMLAAGLVPIFGIAYWVQGDRLFHSSGRIPNWEVLMNWWSNNCSPWFGCGAGSGTVLLGTIQDQVHMHSSFWMFMHNDWLQVLFEQGVLGFVALVVAAASIIWKSRHDRPLLAAALGYSACALFNYPSHMAISAFVGLAVARMAFSSLSPVPNILGGGRVPLGTDNPGGRGIKDKTKGKR